MLDEDARALVVNDFHEGLAHLGFMVEFKFAFWADLPYALCGIAHFSEGVARAAAARCMSMYDDMMREGLREAALLHPLTQQMLAHGSPIRAQLELFVAGALLEDAGLDALLIMCGRLMTVFIIERSVEGLHSFVHRAIQNAPHHGGALISVALRM